MKVPTAVARLGLTPTATTKTAELLERLDLQSPPTMYGFDPNPRNTEHYSRNAVDVMVYSDRGLGDLVASLAWEIGVRHVIWRQRIRSSVVSPGQWRTMRDRGNPTQNHMDHPHILWRATVALAGTANGVHTGASYGAAGTQVFRLQHLLAAAGYDPGPIDGRFGERTRSAVIAYQGAKGLVPDGVVGPLTLSALSGGAVYATDPTIRWGSKGTAVRELQRRLNARGYRLVVDGDFGPLTLAAVSSHQRAHGLVVDGIVGPRTWASLR